MSQTLLSTFDNNYSILPVMPKLKQEIISVTEEMKGKLKFNLPIYVELIYTSLRQLKVSC